MFHTTDLYLGVFLIICGFALSLFNLNKLVKSRNKLSTVLISENLLIMCIGIMFLSRSVHVLHSMTVKSEEIEERFHSMSLPNKLNCDFKMLLMGYGPFIVSVVNSFLSLIIDNYIHYRMIEEVKQKDKENDVQEISHSIATSTERSVKHVFTFWRKYFAYIIIAAQWIMPILVALSMYPIELKTKMLTTENLRGLGDSCMTMVDMGNDNCTSFKNTYSSLEVLHMFPLINFRNASVSPPLNNNASIQIDNVISNVLNIIDDLKNGSKYLNPNISHIPLVRTAKSNKMCMKICYLENKNLLLYMFLLSIVSYFIPITISTIILTKIHVTELKKPNVKTHVSREVLYNILFWSPVMFDTFLSLLFCSYSLNGARTSIFNTIANIYQAVKNFMNTKYFRDNSILPA